MPPAIPPVLAATMGGRQDALEAEAGLPRQGCAPVVSFTLRRRRRKKALFSQAADPPQGIGVTKQHRTFRPAIRTGGTCKALAG